MKLSIVIICWNDRKVILDCLRSIYGSTRTECEVIVSDNGSSDGSVEAIEREFPQAVILRNGANLGFAKGNNVGISRSTGDYVLVLNPDTIVHAGALDRWVTFAEMHPGAGAFGCRILNADGSLQRSARPFPTVWRYWIAALYLRQLGRLSPVFLSDTYTGWEGDSVRQIDWQSGCCLLCRGDLLKKLEGFDEQFFYHFEEVDLCRRIWQSGHAIWYTPDPVVTHLGGRSVGRFPLRFEIEKYRNRYRYFLKHFGVRGAIRVRRVSLAGLLLRRLGYGLLQKIRPSKTLEARLNTYRACMAWNRLVNPVRLAQYGDEPLAGSS